MKLETYKRVSVSDDNRKISSVKYFVLNRIREGISICKATFLSIFGVTQDRVSNIAKYWKEHGISRPENRGGIRVNEDMVDKTDAIRDHINDVYLQSKSLRKTWHSLSKILAI